MSGPDPAAVQATFTSVASRYDLANHFLSFGIDFFWRKKLVQVASRGNYGKILDLATGSGDVALALREGLSGEFTVTGVDFCEPMLERARVKRSRKKLDEKKNQFTFGDFLNLDFEEETFDLVTIAFGLRNLSDRKIGLSEILRVLKPGGRLLILEFSQPYFWFRPFYYLYLRGVLPWLARWVTGDRDAYLYLGSSIAGFPDRSGLAKEIKVSGFEKVRYEALTFSVVALHQGWKKD